MREIVPLALLLVAIIAGLSVTLLRADNESQKEAAEELNPEAPTAVSFDVDAPEGWVLRFKDVSSVDGQLLDGPVGTVPQLNLEYPAAPFGDMRDDGWAVLAEASLRGGSGEWNFEIEYQGSVVVKVNDVEVATGQATELTRLPIKAEQQEGTSSVSIEARDTGGPFVLRWVE